MAALQLLQLRGLLGLLLPWMSEALLHSPDCSGPAGWEESSQGGDRGKVPGCGQEESEVVQEAQRNVHGIQPLPSRRGLC